MSVTVLAAAEWAMATAESERGLVKCITFGNGKLCRLLFKENSRGCSLFLYSGVLMLLSTPGALGFLMFLEPGQRIFCL